MIYTHISELFLVPFGFRAKYGFENWLKIEKATPFLENFNSFIEINKIIQGKDFSHNNLSLHQVKKFLFQGHF